PQNPPPPHPPRSGPRPPPARHGERTARSNPVSRWLWRHHLAVSTVTAASILVALLAATTLMPWSGHRESAYLINLGARGESDSAPECLETPYIFYSSPDHGGDSFKRAQLDVPVEEALEEMVAFNRIRVSGSTSAGRPTAPPPPPSEPPANIAGGETLLPYPGPPAMPQGRSEKKMPPEPQADGSRGRSPSNDDIKRNIEIFDQMEVQNAVAKTSMPDELHDLIDDLLAEQAQLADDTDRAYSNQGNVPVGWEVAESETVAFNAAGKSDSSPALRQSSVVNRPSPMPLGSRGGVPASAPLSHKDQDGRTQVGRQGMAKGEVMAVSDRLKRSLLEPPRHDASESPVRGGILVENTDKEIESRRDGTKDVSSLRDSVVLQSGFYQYAAPDGARLPKSANEGDGEILAGSGRINEGDERIEARRTADSSQSGEMEEESLWVAEGDWVEDDWEDGDVMAAYEDSAPRAKMMQEVSKAWTTSRYGLAASDSPVVNRPSSDEKPMPDFPINPFIDTADNPLSTFAIGTDTASYTLTRQALERGALPEPSQVRVEEFVNAFDYNDGAPERATFRFVVEGAPSPFGRDTTLVRLAIKGKRLGREEKRPAALTFLMDASGSMAQADRIGMARLALSELLGGLSPDDTVQIIAFNDKARVALQQTSASEGADILKAFDSIQTTGPTSLQDGITLAYRMAAATFSPGAENRVVLISDGVANLGSDNAEEILEHIASARRQGIRLSVFGVGRGAYNDALLQQLANKGDGTYRFLDSPDAVRQAFVDDLAATLYTIASDAKVQVEWDPAFVAQYRQLGYEARALTAEQFRDDTVVAGQIGSGQSASALYEIKSSNGILPLSTGRQRQDAVATIGTIRVRFRPEIGKSVQEISHPITLADIAPTFAKARPEFQIAAIAGGFAERLRHSPYAPAQTYRDLADLLRPAAQRLHIDPRPAELVRLLETAASLTR
ncbi:MAG: von Willebrand factor type A domain-containing protein, partial [Kiritimatiellaeota bacterium]|nr:von Willebrand factor type A domain-containing protein [Kiritimatiellota bacterium]